MAAALSSCGVLHGVHVEFRLLRTARRNSIALFHFHCHGAQRTLLWSHANAMDCGEMYFFLAEIASLAASGITSGCSANSFCPNRPVTRGEMAAFLIRALD